MIVHESWMQKYQSVRKAVSQGLTFKLGLQDHIIIIFLAFFLQGSNSKPQFNQEFLVTRLGSASIFLYTGSRSNLTFLTGRPFVHLLQLTSLGVFFFKEDLVCKSVVIWRGMNVSYWVYYFLMNNVFFYSVLTLPFCLCFLLGIDFTYLILSVLVG